MHVHGCGPSLEDPFSGMPSMSNFNHSELSLGWMTRCCTTPQFALYRCFRKQHFIMYSGPSSCLFVLRTLLQDSPHRGCSIFLLTHVYSICKPCSEYSRGIPTETGCKGTAEKVLVNIHSAKCPQSTQTAHRDDTSTALEQDTILMLVAASDSISSMQHIFCNHVTISQTTDHFDKAITVQSSKMTKSFHTSISVSTWVWSQYARI